MSRRRSVKAVAASRSSPKSLASMPSTTVRMTWHCLALPTKSPTALKPQTICTLFFFYGKESV